MCAVAACSALARARSASDFRIRCAEDGNVKLAAHRRCNKALLAVEPRDVGKRRQFARTAASTGNSGKRRPIRCGDRGRMDLGDVSTAVDREADVAAHCVDLT